MAYWATINRNRVKIELSGAPKVGGEGEVYDIKTSSMSDYCAKIYHQEHINDKLIEKLEYMVSHQIAISSNEVRVCWPEILLYDDSDRFQGFIMRKAFANSRDIEILQDNGNMAPLEEEYPKWKDWHRYSFEQEGSYALRLRLLYNVANAVRAIHENRRVVIHDFKPSNILATPEGKISIVDVDSFQIQAETGRVFESAAYTPDYFPKNAYIQESKHIPVNQTCDTFAFAVVAYNTLVGVHPYAGFTRLRPYNTDEYSTLEACIKNDLSPYSKNKKYVKRLDDEFDCHQRLALVDTSLVPLFHQSFDSSKEGLPITVWLSALSDILYPETVRIDSDVKDNDEKESNEAPFEIIPSSFTTISPRPALLLLSQILIIIAFILEQTLGNLRGGVNNSVSFWVAEIVFVGMFALSAAMIFRGFILLHTADIKPVVYVPLYNDAYLSEYSRKLVSIIQENGYPRASIDACNVVIYDYLRELQTDKQIKLDNYLPSFEQFKSFPIESLQLMLSSEKYLSDTGCENQFYSLCDIVQQCQKHLENKS